MMDPNRKEHTALCQRGTCLASTDGHPGGAHLDPRDRAHYDGPGLAYGAAPGRVRAALYPLMLLAGSFTQRINTDDRRADTELRAAVDIAVDGCLHEIDQLRQQVAHVQVDAERKVRAASAAAIDCEHHGATITGLETQLTATDRSGRKSEAGRIAMLDGHQAVKDLLDALAEHGAATGQPATAKAIIAALKKIVDTTDRAHKRAWKD